MAETLKEAVLRAMRTQPDHAVVGETRTAEDVQRFLDNLEGGSVMTVQPPEGFEWPPCVIQFFRDKPWLNDR